MKNAINILILLFWLNSNNAMEKPPQGKRPAAEALSQTRELEEKPTLEYDKNVFLLEALPDELLFEIAKALTKVSRGATKRARLDNAAEDIRSFFRTNLRFKSFETDSNLINYIITELANKHAGGDKVAAAIALGTESARRWLISYFAGPDVTPEIARSRMNGLYENFTEAVLKSRLNVLDFLLSIYDDAWQSIVMNGLREATVQGKVNVINKILSHNAIKLIKATLMNKTNEDGETLLFSAVRANKPQIVDIFIKAGAIVDFLNQFHQTPLHFAVGYPTIVQTLLNAHADPNIANEEGKSLLMLAIFGNDLDTVNLLINAGANVNYVDEEGHSILWHAQHSHVKNKDAIIKLLTDRGAI